MAARTVFSICCEKSGAAVGVCGEADIRAQPLRAHMMRTQGTAARQSDEAHSAHASGTGAAMICANIRFSNAYGTLSLGGLFFAAATSFVCSATKFIHSSI